MGRSLYRAIDLLASGKLARRDFMSAVTALGLTSISAESLFASFGQDRPGANAGEAVKVFEGPAGAAVLEQLKAMGLKYIFNTNTSGFSAILDAVDTNEVQVIMVPQEGLAVSAIHGYALAGGPAPFFCGNKVGVNHAMSNLYNAWKDRTPMLVSFGASGLRGRAGQDGFQEWDEHLEPTELFTAWHWSCLDAQSMPEVVRRAFKFAHTPPGAPVTLDFPPDLLGQKISAPIFRMDPHDVRPVFRAGPGLVEKAARWLVEAKTPVFIVGPEVSRANAGRAMIALAEKVGAPVCQEDDLFCDFPTKHPLFLGSYDTRRFPQTPVDLIIDFGAKIGRVTPGARSCTSARTRTASAG